MAGLDIAIIPMDEKNFKITTEKGLARFICIAKESRIKDLF